MSRARRSPTSRSSRCRPRRTRASASRCIGWPTRSRAGRAGRRASRRPALLFVSGGRVYPDGQRWRGDLLPLTPAGQTALSPAWSPDGQRFAYTQLGAGRGGIVVQTLASGAIAAGPGHRSGPQHHAGVLARRTAAGVRALRRERHRHFTREHRRSLLRATLDRGTLCGQLISNVFTRWPPHRVRLDAGGTAADLRHGRRRDRSGAARAVRLRRHRQLQRARSGRPTGPTSCSTAKSTAARSSSSSTWRGGGSRQLTSSGRNEDPTWAPDGRHITFVSDRSGVRQLWVIDVETGRVRQLADAWRGAAPCVVPPTGSDRGRPLTPERGVLMRAPSLLLVLATAGLAAACGGKPAPEQPAPEPTPAPTPAPTPPPVDDSAERDRLEKRAAGPRGGGARRGGRGRPRGHDQLRVRPGDRPLDRSGARSTARPPILGANPNVKIQISGHADERGSDEYNLALGNRRAAAAKRYLENKGIDASRHGRRLLRRGAAAQPRATTRPPTPRTAATSSRSRPAGTTSSLRSEPATGRLTAVLAATARGSRRG